MKRIENIEDRADYILQQIVKNSQRRDRLLAEVTDLVSDHHALQGSLGAINEVRYQQLPEYVGRSATLAKAIEGSASLAERSSRRVKKLDELSSRVQATKTMAESMISMRETLSDVPAVLASGDLEKSVKLIVEYEKARQQLATRGTKRRAHAAATVTALASSALVPATSTLITQARRETSEQLTKRAEAAMAVNDKLTIMNSARLLSQLGHNKEGMQLYCNWMCDHTIAALKKIVERELRKMESPTEVAMSHLALVSQALDTVAAAYEAEEEFTRETFGHEGPLLLLTLLHQRSTAECVPVLRNFIEKRKDALESLERAAKLNAVAQAADSDNDGEDMDVDERDAMLLLRDSNHGRISGSGGAVVAGNKGSSAADARRADQTLEEMSHVVSCCHIYLDFAEAKRAEHVEALKKEHAARQATAEGEGFDLGKEGVTEGNDDGASNVKKEEGLTASSIVSAADRLWSDDSGGGSNALLGVVQEILAMYVPLQNSYFEAAFQQALQLQLQSIREGGGGGGGSKKAQDIQRGAGAATAAAGAVVGNGVNGKVAGSPSTAFPLDSPASFMAGITNIYSAALGSDGAGGERQAAIAAAIEAENNYYMQGGAITLPDDVFFFLRIAVHRALNTKSTQIASAVIMSATDVVQRQLIPEIAKRAAPPKRWRSEASSSSASSPPPPPTPRALRWVCAAQQVAEYARKLAQELRVTTGAQQLQGSSTKTAAQTGSAGGAASFSSRDLLRFREMAQDIDILAKDLKTTEATWLAQDAAMCTAYIAATSGHLERFASISYNITEEVFYHFELNDPWAQAFLVDWAALLDYVGCHLYEPGLFDLLLTEIARGVARRVREIILKKHFSTFGALQFDKDVRALREFFFQRAHEISALREVFAPLSLTSTLLLSDAPRDAMEESHNMALTAEEKRAVLLLRADFKRSEVLVLKL